MEAKVVAMASSILIPGVGVVRGLQAVTIRKKMTIKRW
jgi:hypothetical protein